MFMYGASAEGRPGFQRLVAEVGLGRVGLVLGVEMSRLARSCRDWHQLLEICALRDTLTALLGVLIVLWLALRSMRIIVAVFFSLMVGLAATAALGLAMVGSFNLISIAFFVLFVGLGVDFGIQFSVRYRSERHELLTGAVRLFAAPLVTRARCPPAPRATDRAPFAAGSPAAPTHP